MTIGIIGAGKIATNFAVLAHRAGHETVLSNSRGPRTLTDLPEGARAGTVAEAASQRVVLLAVNWDRVGDALAGLPRWSGQVVIDATNAFSRTAGETFDLGGRGSSEIVAEQIPGAHLVKAANTHRATDLAQDPAITGGRMLMPISGDDADAKATVAAIFAAAGWATIDLGDLAHGGRLQEFPGSAAFPLRHFAELD